MNSRSADAWISFLSAVISYSLLSASLFKLDENNWLPLKLFVNKNPFSEWPNFSTHSAVNLIQISTDMFTLF